MIILRLFVFVLFILSLNLISYSQESPKGFIVTYDNDTIYGEFHRNLNKNSLTECHFKATTENEFNIYTPEKIKEFNVNDNRQFRSVISCSGDKRTLVFYELIYDGENALYYHKDINDEYLYIEDRNNKVFLLKNSNREMYSDNIKYKKEYKEYIGILKYIFRDKPELFPKIEKLSLTQKSLIHFFQNLNTTQTSSFIKTFEKAKLRISLSTGFQNININSGYDFGEDLYYLDNSNFKFNNYIVSGITFELNIPEISKVVSTGYELSYSKPEFETTNYKSFSTNSLNYESFIKLKRTSLNNLIYLKYGLPYRKLKPALLVGAYANFSIQDDYYRRLIARWPNNDIYADFESTQNPFNMCDYGFCFGTSLEKTFNNNMALSGNIRYKTGTGLRHGLNANYLAFTLDFFFANIKL